MAQRIFTRALIVLGAVLLALTIAHQLEKSRRSSAKKEMALARCEGPGASECRARVEARHERCFERNDEVGQTRVTPGSFDDRGYLACVANVPAPG